MIMTLMTRMMTKRAMKETEVKRWRRWKVGLEMLRGAAAVGSEDESQPPHPSWSFLAREL